jgi:hypothetical protein
MKLQLNQRYTSRQLALLGPFARDGTATTDKILAYVSVHSAFSGSTPTLRSVTTHLRAISGKLALDGYVIHRDSELGRGNKGLWRLQKIN